MSTAEAIAPRTPEGRSLGVRVAVLLVVFYASLMGLGLGSARALTRHEVFAAQPAREMLAYGGSSSKWWLIQHFGEEPRYQKPPAMSWLIAGSVVVFGEREWAVRVPAVAAGGVVVLLSGWLTARMYGRRTGVVAGAMQSTFFYMVMQARLAEVDIVLAAAVFGALVCAAAVWVPGVSGRQGGWGWGFAVLGGVSMALKGPVGPGLVLAGMAGFAAARGWMGGWREGWAVVRWVVHPMRLGVMAVVAASWPLAAVTADPGILAFWQKELLARVTTGAHVGAGGVGGEPWWFYTWNVPMLVVPWVLVLPWAVVEGGRNRVGAGWAVGVLAGGVLLLSVVADKHKHYVVPVLPVVTPFLAAGLMRLLSWQHGRAAKGYGVLMAMWLVAGAGGVAGVWVWGSAELRWGVMVAVGLLTLGGLVAIEMERRRRMGAQLAAMFATAWLTLGAVNAVVTPAAERFWVFRAFAMAARAEIREGERVELVGLGMHPVAFYLPMPLGRLDRVEEGWFPATGRWLVMSASGVERWGSVWAERGVGLRVVVEGEPMRGGDRAGERLVLVRTVAAR